MQNLRTRKKLQIALLTLLCSPLVAFGDVSLSGPVFESKMHAAGAAFVECIEKTIPGLNDTDAFPEQIALSASRTCEPEYEAYWRLGSEVLNTPEAVASLRSKGDTDATRIKMSLPWVLDYRNAIQNQKPR